MNIYVGNISYRIDEMDLRKIFEEYGEVTSIKLITDKYTGSSKGNCTFIRNSQGADHTDQEMGFQSGKIC